MSLTTVPTARWYMSTPSQLLHIHSERERVLKIINLENLTFQIPHLGRGNVGFPFHGNTETSVYSRRRRTQGRNFLGPLKYQIYGFRCPLRGPLKYQILFQNYIFLVSDRIDRTDRRNKYVLGLPCFKKLSSELNYFVSELCYVMLFSTESYKYRFEEFIMPSTVL